MRQIAQEATKYRDMGLEPGLDAESVAGPGHSRGSKGERDGKDRQFPQNADSRHGLWAAQDLETSALPASTGRQDPASAGGQAVAVPGQGSVRLDTGSARARCHGES